jgi:hypothetical protein
MPVTLMIEMRERLVRIETKMDSSAEKVAKHETELTGHDGRLTALETAQTTQKAQLRLVQWAGGALVAAGSLASVLLPLLK